MPQQDPSRTEKATAKRRNKARRDGNVPRSQEVGKTLVIFAGLIGMTFYIKYIGQDMRLLFTWFLGQGMTFVPNEQNVYRLLISLAAKIAVMVMPVLLFVGFVGFMSARLQVGPLWSTKMLRPKFSTIFNPLGGIKKMMLSPKAFIRLGKSLLQAVVIAWAAYVVLKDKFDEMLPLYYQTAEGLCVFILDSAASMVYYALIPMLIIAAVDLWYTRWDYEENLKMTKEEVKDERKQMEGDPIIKKQQKEKMLGAMMKRMMQSVPKADVVVTNPTHYAVAVRYDPMEAPAPMVLAKGVNRVAEKIKEIARENNVPIRENKPLAQALYKSVEVGEVIPEELYQAVASILAQLHKFKNRRG